MTESVPTEPAGKASGTAAVPTGFAARVEFKAFISYSHARDGLLAPAVQAGLHRFAKPWNKLRAFRVFRDHTSLSASPHLWTSIANALASSEFFVLLASPDAAESPWVRREVEYWRQHKPETNLLIVVTDGEIVWNDQRGEFDWDRTTALPRTLEGFFREEPLYVDLRWGHEETQLSLAHPRFRQCIGDLAAPMHGRSKDDMLGEDVRQHRRTVSLVRSVITILATLVLLAGTLAVVAVDQRDQARAQSEVARSRQLSAESTVALPKDPGLGLRLATEAFRASPTQEAEDSLRQAISTPGSRVTLTPDDRLGPETAFSLDGRSVVTSDVDRDEVLVWNWPSKSRPRVLKGRTPVNSLAFSADGTLVVGAGNDGTVWVWRWASEETVTLLEGHEEGVRGAAFSRNGESVVSASLDGTARVWDWRSRRELWRLAVGSIIESAAFSPDGERLVISGVSGVELWELVDGAEPVVLDGHTSNVRHVAFSPDGNWVVSAGEDGTARVWSADAEIKPTVLDANAGVVSVVAMSHDGRYVLTDGVDGNLRVWDWALGARPTVLRGHPRVFAAAFSPDSTKVVSGGPDGVRVWDWTVGSEPVVFPGHVGAVAKAAFSPDSLRVASHGGTIFASTVSVWDWGSVSKPVTRSGNEGMVMPAFSPDDEHIVTGGPDGTLLVWDWDSGAEPTVLRGHEGSVGSAGFSSDGKRIVSGGQDGTVRVWDWASGAEPTVLRGHEGFVGSDSFSPDGKRVVSSGLDGTVRVWDWASGREPLVLQADTGSVRCASFSPDGKYIVSLGKGGTVRVWDSVSGKQAASLPGAEGGVRTVSFSPDGERVLTASSTGVVRVWTWASHARATVLPTVGGDNTVALGGNGITAVFSDDTEWIAVSDENGNLGVRDCPGCGAMDQILKLARAPVVL